MTTERQNYFAPGLWNACCMGCGAKLKSDELRKDWQGFMKCQRCWEPRHPQDFVRARTTAEPAPVPFTRQPATPIEIEVCSVFSIASLPDAATANCWLADYVSPSFDPSAE